MMLLVSKLVAIFLYPVGAVCLLLLLTLLLHLAGRGRLAFVALLAAGLYLWLASTPMIANSLYAGLESRYPSIALQDTPERDVVIVLGGSLGQPLPPRTETDLGGAADRVLTTARLYRMARAKFVLVAAGNLPWKASVRSEAALTRDLLMEWGVDESAILLDERSRNSYENARNTARMMREWGLESALLVTSAAHMPRAMAVFRKQGLDVFPVPTDYQVISVGDSGFFQWLPDVDALAKTTAFLREWLGMHYYRWRGWL